MGGHRRPSRSCPTPSRGKRVDVFFWGGRHPMKVASLIIVIGVVCWIPKLCFLHVPGFCTLNQLLFQTRCEDEKQRATCGPPHGRPSHLCHLPTSWHVPRSRTHPKQLLLRPREAYGTSEAVAPANPSRTSLDIISPDTQRRRSAALRGLPHPLGRELQIFQGLSLNSLLITAQIYLPYTPPCP